MISPDKVKDLDLVAAREARNKIKKQLYQPYSAPTPRGQVTAAGHYQWVSVRTESDVGVCEVRIPINVVKDIARVMQGYDELAYLYADLNRRIDKLSGMAEVMSEL